ncbi:rho guanine nucleotide exchange factor 17 isoform X1 [Diabrotica undecimpunctata]
MTIKLMDAGMRVGAVSPPPPGVGLRYLSHQSCWPSTPCSDSGYDNALFSRIPLFPRTSLDRSSCEYRVPLSDENPSNKLASQQTSVTVRGTAIYSNKYLLKNQLKPCTLVRPAGQIYKRIAAYGDINDRDNTLDRLPRFRFGGNRTSAAEKRNKHHKYKELTSRLKRDITTVPSARSRHGNKANPTLLSMPISYSPDDLKREVVLRNTSVSSDVFYQNKYPQHQPPHKLKFEKLQGIENQISLTEVHTSTKPQSILVDLTQASKQELTVFEVGCATEDLKALNVLIEASKTAEGDIADDKLTHLENSLNDKKKRKARRRKGIYISQWPNTYQSTEDIIPQLIHEGDFACIDSTSKFIKESLVEISKLSISDERHKEYSIWISSQERMVNSDENDLAVTKLVSRNLEEVTDNNEFKANLSPEYNKSNHILVQSDKDKILNLNTDSNAKNIPLLASRNNSNSELNISENLPSVPCASLNNLSKPKHRRTRGSLSSSSDETSNKDVCVNFNLNTPKQHKKKMSNNNVVIATDVDIKNKVNQQRTTSSPSKLDYINAEENSDLLERLLIRSFDQLTTNDANQNFQMDTRTHVVVELFDNEKSYVESLRIMITEYLEPLKSPDNVNLLDGHLVNEIFYQIPELYSHHQHFLTELQKRLEQWDIKQKVGDVFLEMFTNTAVIESYTNYVNNWKRAREIIKNAQQSKPAFSRFLEVTARQNSGKLTIDSLLIKPIQKFPKYELLLQRIIKHTDESHPDHNLLLAAQSQVHEQLLKINCTEREALDLEQLREIEGLIDGLINLAVAERQYLRHDYVSMSHRTGYRKERALFLFSDLLVITGIKRKSGTIRRPTTGQGGITSTLEANKYKLLMKIPLEDIELNRSKDDNMRQIMTEVDNLTDDISLLNQIHELACNLHYSHTNLDEVVKEMLASLNKHLIEQQNSDSQLACLDLTISTPNGPENVSIIFTNVEKRTSWEESLTEAKQKLATSTDRVPSPELLATVPIRKTRAGLQFTCAAPTVGYKSKDVWVCNSDGYVGQVCVLSLLPEPNVTSCNGVCNRKIVCIASVPGINNRTSTNGNKKVGGEPKEHKMMNFDSSSSSDEDENCDNEINEQPQHIVDSEVCSVENDEADNYQSTMWLGTEDGCIYIYNCSDNIRIKKNKGKLQLGASILSIIYLDNRVYVSLANGDITVYDRDSAGTWNSSSSAVCTVGSLSSPVSKIVPYNGKLWCGCGSSVKIFDGHSLAVENSFVINNDSNKSITCIVLSGNGVWLSLQNSAIIKCYQVTTFELICEINVAPSVTKMLTSCDDIIRQHKAACLRVTALVACKDLLWIGTSAGVLLTMPLPHISSTTTKLTTVPTVNGVPHGHTGHVRFLTSVEMPANELSHRISYKSKQETRSSAKFLVISGGDGYEDFRTSNMSEVAGREDSTNHLLLWNI